MTETTRREPAFDDNGSRRHDGPSGGLNQTTDLVPILRLSDDPLTNAAADRIEKLECALHGLLDALAMGPLEIAAKYGPDAHPDEPLVDAAHKARAVLET